MEEDLFGALLMMVRHPEHQGMSNGSAEWVKQATSKLNVRWTPTGLPW